MQTFIYEDQLYLLIGVNGQFALCMKAIKSEEPGQNPKIAVKNGDTPHMFPLQLVDHLINEQIKADKPKIEIPE